MAIKIFGEDVASTINVSDNPSLGAYHLAQDPTLWEPQRSNNFAFIVSDLDNILRAGVTGTEAQARLPHAQEFIKIAVSKAFVPHYEQGTISIKRGNTEVKYAGAISFKSGTLDVVDYIGADTVSILQAWQNLSGNVKTEKVGLASDYKKECTLIEYTPDGQIVRKWKLEGCWISALSEDDYNQEQNDKRMISATIEYDKGYIDVSSLQ